jgi:hypothetical protein
MGLETWRFGQSIPLFEGKPTFFEVVEIATLPYQKTACMKTLPRGLQFYFGHFSIFLSLFG